MLGDHYAFGKRTFYEQSARIPLVMSWPARLPSDETREQFAQLTDLYGTVIDAAGGRVPEESFSISLLEAACSINKIHRDEVYGEFGLGHLLKMMRRWDSYKYVYHTNGGYESVFNLSSDPDELEDIAEAFPDLCTQSRAKMVEYYRSFGFEEPLDGEGLKVYPFRKHERHGYLNQFPRWQNTIIE